ncbi:DUF3696 domain-containing protein [Bacteroides sp. AN502(2024)]|uniref:AAA family ATPase n=1 Tax=Bacteroides sp. AN502(2024) TaxID=3160599 RepID=UPI003514BCEC
MITSLFLKNFKAFSDVEINLSPLTLFCGKNGMGKSSLIQSLLILRQSYMADKSLSRLQLNGDLTNIGYGKDLYNIEGDGDIVFDIVFEKIRHLSLSYSLKSDSDILQLIKGNADSFNIGNLSLFNDKFQYLNAERITPKRTYEASPYAVEVLRTLGEKGQYAVHYLDKYKFDTIPNLNLKHPNAKSNTLLDNVNAWISEITSEVRVKPRFHPDLKISTLGYEFINQKDTTPEFTSVNTGFGITYVLPIIIALLNAQKGDLLIFENPESHLHPKGQVMLGKLISYAANDGVQILVESHSDHIFNGMRVAIKEKRILANNFSVYFFSRAEEGHSIYIEEPLVDSDGRLSFQPNDFFDEYTKQLSLLIQKD